MAETPQGLIPAGTMAKEVQVGMSMIHTWRKRGIITSAHQQPNGTGILHYFDRSQIRIARLASDYMMFGFNRDQIYQLLTTKKGRLGLQTKQECLDTLEELRRGEAEVWKAIDEQTAATG